MNFRAPKIILIPSLFLSVFFLFSCQQKQQAKHHFLDLSARDTTVRPQDNFYKYANGTWLKNAKIPADKVAKNAFNVRKKLNNRIKVILDSCTALKEPKIGRPAQQIGALYTAAMDSTAINKVGLQPLQPALNRIAAISTPEDIVNEVAQEYKDGDWFWDWYNLFYTNFSFGQLVTLFVFTDDKNSHITRFHCDQGGIGLPDKGYYFKTDPRSRAVVKSYIKYISRILALSGDSTNAHKDAADIYSLEKKLAKASKPHAKLQDPKANYHLMSVRQMNKMTPNISWHELLNKMSIHTDTLLVGQPEYYKALSGLLASEPVGVWKKYLSFHLISHFSPWMSKPFAKANFDFYGKELAGRQKQQTRWKRVADLINATIGDALGQLYVKRYFPPSSKKYIMHLVDNLKSAYHERIQKLSWMSDSTKEKALDKLNAIVKKIGYPDNDKWKDYTSVKIEPDALITDLKNIGQWYFHYDMDKLHQPVDRSEWFLTPTTVNAYYNPNANDINFPAGILVPPFYFKNGDDALNYGGIGMVISHEMTHGFDNIGSQYDKDGSLKTWWTKRDREMFNKRAEKAVNQYNSYIVQDTIHLNGKSTEMENIADVGGLAIAYSAFKKTKEGRSNALINGLTPNQRFFLAVAQIWRVKVRPKALLVSLAGVDPHSPPEYRVNGPLSDLPAFYKVFDIKPGDKMYRPDSLRVSLW